MDSLSPLSPPFLNREDHFQFAYRQPQCIRPPLPSPAPSLPPPRPRPQIVNADVVPRPLTLHEEQSLAHLDRLKFFLATAPSNWGADGPPSDGPLDQRHPALNRFLLPTNEYVSCVLWSGLYHITGTDIVRALVFRFEAFGRPICNMKKFEEGVFSDLRNLKPGTDACLEEPKSPFLDLLFKYQCVRTQKKQKVFYWFSVPHDRLFLDALERDLKREKMGGESTTVVIGEPARSFKYDAKRGLYEQFIKQDGAEDADELERAARQAGVDVEAEASFTDSTASSMSPDPVPANSQQVASMFSLFEGSPTYKQRRKRAPKARSKLRSTSLLQEEDRAGSSSASEGDDGYVSGSQRGDSVGLGIPGLPQHQMQYQQDAYVGVDPVQYAPYPVAPRMDPAQSFLYSLPTPPASGGHSQFPSRHPPAPGKTRVYACQLHTCGRMFKRMEHLRRHVRTHTMEKPYACARCKKRFSRSDNLAQHVRIHAREDANGGLTKDEYGYDEDTDVEALELDEEEERMVADAQEIEVDASFSEAAEHEDGLLPPTSHPYGNAQYATSAPTLPVPHFAAVFTPPDSSRFAPSSAGTWPPVGPSGSSMLLYPTLQHRTAPSSPAFTGSASSHKATLDPALFSSFGPGPIRRHRSATPGMTGAPYPSVAGRIARRGATVDSVAIGQMRAWKPYASPLATPLVAPPQVEEVPQRQDIHQYPQAQAQGFALPQHPLPAPYDSSLFPDNSMTTSNASFPPYPLFDPSFSTSSGAEPATRASLYPDLNLYTTSPINTDDLFAFDAAAASPTPIATAHAEAHGQGPFGAYSHAARVAV